MASAIHAVRIWHGYWSCQACDFIGDLWQAVKHAVANQFEVRY